jgi:hypothetical protein
MEGGKPEVERSSLAAQKKELRQIVKSRLKILDSATKSRESKALTMANSEHMFAWLYK